MTALRVLGFDGLIPRVSATLMGEQFAQIASNVKLYSKELRPWRNPIAVDDQPPPNVYKTLYRLFNSASGDAVFLLWLTDVDVAVSPVADTTGETRVYYTGDGLPKKTNWAMATSGAQPYPSTWMYMGVPAAGLVAPSAVLTVSGTGALETRHYVYTLVSTFGAVKAESAPSPPSLEVNVPLVGSTVRVSGFTGYPATPEYNVTAYRIYRTVVGAETVSYQFVAEIPVATTFYDDTKTAAELGEVLGTIGWVGPPDNLAGLVALPGGALAGFVGNTVYFSEPYYPHAWPLKYAITIPVRKIIGLSVVGSSVVVMSTTNPFFIHGGFPGDMYVEKIPLQEPCVGKKTIASDEDGTSYASPNGLVVISPSQRSVATTNLFTADEWRPLIPQTMISAILQGRYFGVFPNEVPARAIILSATDPPALSMMNIPAIALHTDAVNGFLFYVHDTDHKIYQLDADFNSFMTYRWKSKRFLAEQGHTFSLLRVDADYRQLGDIDNSEYDAALAWNNANFAGDLMGAINGADINHFDINGSILKNLPNPAGSRGLSILLYGDDGLLRASLSPQTLDPRRIPSFKSREFEVEIIGNIDVRSLHFATTLEELRAT